MCDCIARVNNELIEMNTGLDIAIHIFKPEKPNMVHLETYKLDKKVRRGPIRIVATYCPFCGQKYETDGVDMTVLDELNDYKW